MLKEEGIIPFQLILGETSIEGPINSFLAPLEILIINVPPKLRGAQQENYVLKMKLLYKEILAAGVKKIIFVSSTSVYGELEGDVTEITATMPVRESGKQLLKAEELFRVATGIQTSILRFGGLIGPKRHPVTTLSGREGLKNGGDYINLIHLDDCIGMILFIIRNAYWNEIFNGVYPEHPIKSNYYTSVAIKMGLPVPKYVLNYSKNRGKRIISRNILNKNYQFSTPLSA